MSRYEHGRVLAVNETTLGSELVGAHAAGVSSLTVEDPVDFDEDGGWLSINGQVVEYSTYDDDNGEITLVGTLDAAAGEGDRVDLWDELRQVVTVDKIAQVELDGDDDNTDPLEATIPLHLLDDLAEGIRGVRGESVLLEQDGDEWRIVDVLGLAANGASGVQFKREPVFTLTQAGTQNLTISEEPIPESVQVRINGVDYHPADGWTRDGTTVTLLSNIGARVGDEVSVQYAYRVGVAAPSETALVAFGSSGWRYLEVAGTDTNDFSAPTFDDSTWAVGTAPLTWTSGQGRKLWMRRTFPAATSGRVYVYIEDHANIYVNGQLAVALPPKGEGVAHDDKTIPYSIDPALLNTSGVNSLAVEAIDDVFSNTFADVEIWGVAS